MKPIPFMLLTAAVALSAHGAMANDLPGVSMPEPIVTPIPQPESDDALPAGSNGGYKVGDWDVKISGSVSIDIGTGAAARPSRR